MFVGVSSAGAFPWSPCEGLKGVGDGVVTVEKSGGGVEMLTLTDVSGVETVDSRDDGVGEGVDCCGELLDDMAGILSNCGLL